MIIDTMTMDEIQNEAFKIYPIIYNRAIPYAKAFRKKIKNSLRGKLIVWKHHDEIMVDGNKVLIYYSSREGTLKDFSMIYFIQVNNSAGYKEYYQLKLGGFITKFTKHFIDRFIERTNCGKDFLPYLVKELSPVSFLQYKKGIYSYQRTLNGLAVIANLNTYITYMNDLSQYKSEIKDGLDIMCEDILKDINLDSINRNIVRSMRE
jgi:hypothetical protein